MGYLNTKLRALPTWVLYLGGALPAAYLFYLALAGQLGADPVKVLEHRYGEIALQFLIATLSVTPLRRYLGLNLLKFRRALGLLSFAYVLCHLLVWLVLDVQILSQIIGDILKRPYITIGMAAFILLLPLALTSNTRAIRAMGRNWRRLHWLTYPAAILGALHFVLLAKGFQLAPLMYAGVIMLLLLLRVRWRDSVRFQSC